MASERVCWGCGGIELEVAWPGSGGLSNRLTWISAGQAVVEGEDSLRTASHDSCPFLSESVCAFLASSRTVGEFGDCGAV